MNKIRFFIALYISKIAVIALKLFGYKGTDFSGYIAFRICPDFLRYIKKPDLIIGVTGTNGKTTVTNLIADSLSILGENIVSNKFGSNLHTGAATVLLKNSKIFGGVKSNIAVIEIDERSFRITGRYITPNYIIITNLTRDSIMRHAHPDFISQILTKYIPADSKLIINADNLSAVITSPKNERIYFGIKPMSTDKKISNSIIHDVNICPICQEELVWDYCRYSDIGSVRCPKCGFHTPEYNYFADHVDLEKKTISFYDNSSIILDNVKLINDTLFNIYNQLAVMTLLSELGYSGKEITKCINNLDILHSRLKFDVFHGDMQIKTMLSKGMNGYANSRIFEYINSQERPTQIVLMINSEEVETVWSENICWIYDADFELLNFDFLDKVIMFCPRKYDYKNRLLFAGVPEDKILLLDDYRDAPQHIRYIKDSSVFILHDIYNEDKADFIRKSILSGRIGS